MDRGAKMKYTLTMSVSNIKHYSWWWNGKSTYEFESLDELIDFAIKHIPLSDRSVDFIIQNDKAQDDGKLACTSWYMVTKGEDKMTGYTSF